MLPPFLDSELEGRSQVPPGKRRLDRRARAAEDGPHGKPPAPALPVPLTGFETSSLQNSGFAFVIRSTKIRSIGRES